MSIRLMTRAWDANCESHTAKLVLLKLADNANDQGVCWPSIGKIAEQCELSEQGVREQIEKLHSKKFIQIERAAGKSNHYTIFPPISAVGGSPPNAVDPTPQPRRVHPPTALRTPPNAVETNRKEPSLNHQVTLPTPRLSSEWFDPNEDQRAGQLRRWESAKKWMAEWNKAGANYSVSQLRKAVLSLEANGWMWGRNPVFDPRMAIMSKLESMPDDRPVENAI